jgi:hypothetical protein
MLRRAEVERELEEQATRLRRIERRIVDLDEHQEEDVRFRSLPAYRILATRGSFESFDEARAFVGELLRAVPQRPGRLLALQHAVEYEPEFIDREIGFELTNESANEKEMEVAERTLVPRELEAVARAAICVRVGPPDEAHRQTRSIANQLQVEGLALDGPNREVFLTLPSPTQPPVVEMQFPARRVS